MGEKLRDAVIWPFYAIGWLVGKVVAGCVFIWKTVELGYREARGGRQSVE